MTFTLTHALQGPAPPNISNYLFIYDIHTCSPGSSPSKHIDAATRLGVELEEAALAMNLAAGCSNGSSSPELQQRHR
jgi:hypothetical protein